MLYKRSLSAGAHGLSLTVDSATYQLCSFGQITSSLGSCSLICKPRTLILVMYFLEFLGASNEIMAMHGRDYVTSSLNSFHFPHEHKTRPLFLAPWLHLVETHDCSGQRKMMYVTSLHIPHHHHH